MSEEKKTRQMSMKGFIAKTNSKAAHTGMGFLNAHRAYLTTGEPAVVTKPIIDRLDRGEILPTPAIKEIAKAVMDHMIAVEVAKAEKSMAEANAPPVMKDWISTIYNGEGKIQTRMKEDGEEEELRTSFDEPARADDWCYRRLVEASSDCYAEVTHSKSNVKTIIHRKDALAKTFKQKRGPAVSVKGMSTKSLGFGVKAKQSRSSFSRG